MNEVKIKEEVLQTIRQLNEAWTKEGNIDKLNKYFHEDMVVFEPGRKERREGKRECVEGWKNFVESVKINYWNENDHKVQLYGDGKFAVVTYYWDISYEKKSQTNNFSGRDMFVLIKEKGKWWTVADQFSANP